MTTSKRRKLMISTNICDLCWSMAWDVYLMGVWMWLCLFVIKRKVLVCNVVRKRMSGSPISKYSARWGFRRERPKIFMSLASYIWQFLRISLNTWGLLKDVSGWLVCLLHRHYWRWNWKTPLFNWDILISM